jgi:23S rRNA pseudouridine2605 synthase
MTDQTSVRLNKYLALHLGVSRREADDLISGGHVTINGQTATLGNQATEGDDIAVSGTPLVRETNHTTIVVDKPVGYVCSRRRQGDTPTIYELLPERYHALKTVGRLDKDSSGVLLLTNDGDLAHQMTHPSFHKQKAYEVTLDQPLAPLHRQMISDYGVLLHDGKSQLQLERLVDGDDTRWRVVMHEGRNRQIRRTFAALGYTVTHLRRTAFGPYTLTDVTRLDELRQS